MELFAASDSGNSLDGVDLAQVLTSMASIKPLFQQTAGDSASSSPSAHSPQDHTYNTTPVISLPSPSAEFSPSSDFSPPDPGEQSRKRSRMKDEKICGVCSDKALGFNFNAITCESCKAFFRRNALKAKTECLFQGNCVIDTRTRRFCPACRINKCLSIGMKTDMILDDKEKRARMERVVQNRTKKHMPDPVMQQTVLANAAVAAATAAAQAAAAAAAVEEPRESKPLVNASPAFPVSMSTSSIPVVSYQDGVKKIPCRQFGLPQTVQGRMFRHPPRELLPSDPQFYRRLTEDEKWILNDISTAFQATVAVLSSSEPHSKPPNPKPSLNELINSTDETVRQLIRFVGKVGDFQQMHKDDQISCLKNNVMQSVLLRSACVYILEKDVFLCSKGEVPTSFLGALENPALYAAHVHFCRSIKSIILNNYTLWALAQILALFNPCGNAILDREMLSSLQDKYTILLKHYLESEFAFTFAQDYMVALQDMLGDLKALGEAYTTVIYNVNPTEIEPLLLEVFNLK